MRKKRKKFYLILILVLLIILLWIFQKREEKKTIYSKGIITQRLENYTPVRDEEFKKFKKKELKEKLKTKIEREVKIKHYKPALVSIIIDDMGQGTNIEKEILNLKYPLTISLLPHNNSYKINKNFQVILHQPMEPENPKIDAGKSAITTKMEKEEIRKQIEVNLKNMPLAIGVNNHMGSLATSEEEVMSAVLEVVKEKNLFFVDSRTSANSCGYSLAKSMNIPTIKRDVFLDGKRNESYIRGQFLLLEEIAQKKGYAVGIIHPHKESIAVLKEMIPKMEKEGIKFVHISELVE